MRGRDDGTGARTGLLRELPGVLAGRDDLDQIMSLAG
jgi:hypothetical protein